ncbi:MAG: hypothetical protein ACRCXZ_08350 [Patescibacteria group bacterium]
MNKTFRTLNDAKNYFSDINPKKEVNIYRLNMSTCPYCKGLNSLGQGINMISYVSSEKTLENNRTCINKSCGRNFIDIFDVIENNDVINFNKINTLKIHDLDTNDFVLYFTKIGEKDVFSRFHNLYAEAIEAMDNGMDEASGMLLRKALEALVIDYIRYGARIKGSAKDIRYLESQGLMKCVEMIEDVTLKELAKRAVWIGNDNVHTKKKWNHFDSDDMNRILGAIVLNIHAKMECIIYLRKMNRK